eukprot:10902266-Lingulodinium_polyedra.AAC.1
MSLSGGYSDDAEYAWVEEARVKSFDDLVVETSDRFRRAEMQLARALAIIISKSDGPLKYDVNAKLLESGRRLRGRQIFRMVLDFFPANKALRQ